MKLDITEPTRSFHLSIFHTLVLATVVATVPLRARAAAPPNDSFANAIVLGEANVQQSRSTNVEATKEAGESQFYGNSTVWWVWRAPANGLVSLGTDGSANFVKVFTISIGDLLETQRAIHQNFRVREALASIPVTRGTTYRIAIGGDPAYSGDNTGPISLNLLFSTNNAYGRAHIPKPVDIANDRFASRTSIEDHRLAPGGHEASAIGYSAYASEEPFEPSVSGVATCWWEWKSPLTGLASINTTGSAPFVKNLVVYQGFDFSELTPFALQSRAREPQLVFPVTQGTTYRLSVGGDPAYSGDNSGFILLNILVQRAAIPSDLYINTDATCLNDNFVNRVPLSGGRNSAGAGRISAIGSNISASKEAFEPTATTGDASVWWVWTAPGNGATRVHLTGSDGFVKHLTAWTGNGFGALELKASDFRKRSPEIRFDAVAGTQYSICVGGDPGYSGDNRGSIVLTIEGPIVPESQPIKSFRIRTAIELEVQTTPGAVYQIQSSPDFGAWNDWEAPFTGDGSLLRFLRSTRQDTARFFRLKITKAGAENEFVYP